MRGILLILACFALYQHYRIRELRRDNERMDTRIEIVSAQSERLRAQLAVWDDVRATRDAFQEGT